MRFNVNTFIFLLNYYTTPQEMNTLFLKYKPYITPFRLEIC